MDIGIKLWKLLVIIILIEIAFFSGMVIKGEQVGTQKEVEYIVEEKRVGEPIYLEECPRIPEEAESREVKGIGIRPDGETGVVINLIVTIAEGNGEVFMEVSENTYGESFQSSMRDVKEAVHSLTGKSFEQTQIGFDSSATGSLKGASGSLATGVGLYALIENKTVMQDKAITGVLGSNGRVKSVSHLEEKIEAAKNSEEIKEVLIPPVRECEDLKNQYGTQINIKCVNSLEEAVKITTK